MSAVPNFQLVVELRRNATREEGEDLLPTCWQRVAMNRAHLQTSPVGHARLLARLPDPTTRRDLRLRAGLSLRHLADEIGGDI